MSTVHGPRVLHYGDTICLFSEQTNGFVFVPKVLDPSLAVCPLLKDEVIPPNFENATFTVLPFDTVHDVASNAKVGVVKYGHVVKLLHIGLDNKIICCRRKQQASRGTSNWKITLEEISHKAKGCLWRIMPRFKVRVEGESVHHKDDIILEVFQAEESLHVSPVLEHGTFEVNGSTTKSNFIAHIFTNKETVLPGWIKGGDVVTIMHAETQTLLVTHTDEEGEGRVLMESKNGDLVTSETKDQFSSNSLFIVEHEEPLNGDGLMFGHSFRLRNLAKRTYLCVERNGAPREYQLVRHDTVANIESVQSITGDFMCSLVDQPSDLGTLFRCVSSTAQATPINPVTINARVYLESVPHNVWLGSDRKDIRDSKDSSKTRLEVQIDLFKQPMQCNGFEIMIVPPKEYFSINVVLSFMPDMQAYLNAYQEKEIADAATVERMIEALTSLIRYCTKSSEPDPLRREGTPIKKHQKLILDQGIVKLCIMALQIPFEQQVLTFESLQRTENAEILFVCRLCYRLIRQTVVGSLQFANQLKEHIPFVYSQMGYGLGAEETLTELFKDNEELISSLIHNQQIQNVVNVICTKGRHPRYIDFLINLCECNGVGLPRQQNLISQHFLVEHPESLLKMERRGDRTKIQMPTEHMLAQMRQKIDLEAFSKSTVSDIYKYHLSCINMFAKLCTGRNKKTVNVVSLFAPVDALFDGIVNPKLPYRLRAAFVSLYHTVFIDREPHVDLAQQRLVQVWDSITEKPRDQQTVPVEVATLKSLISTMLRKHSSMESSQTERNVFLLELIKTCRLFVQFGFYRQAELVELVATLRESLDGRTDAEGGDNVFIFESQEEGAELNKHEDMLQRIEGKEWDRTKSTSPEILECKKHICSVIGAVLDLNNSVLMQQIIYNYKFKLQPPHIAQANDTDPFSTLDELSSKMDTAANPSVSEGSNKIVPVESQFRHVQHLLDILVDLLFYEDNDLVVTALQLQFRCYNKTEDVVQMLHNVQLLYSDMSVQAYNTAKNLLRDLQNSLSSTSVTDRELFYCKQAMLDLITMCSSTSGGVDWIRNLGLHRYTIEAVLHIPYKGEPQGALRELFEAAYLFISKFCGGFPANQNAVFPHLSFFLEHYDFNSNVALALEAIIKSNIDLCGKISNNILQFFCERISVDHQFPLTFLRQLVLVDNVVIQRNQNFVLKYLFRRQKEKEDYFLFFNDAAGVARRDEYLRQSSSPEISYHLSMVGLLRACVKGQGSKVKSMCRGLLSLDVIFDVLIHPTLPTYFKQPYSLFLFDVWFDDQQVRSTILKTPKLWKWVDHCSNSIQELATHAILSSDFSEKSESQVKATVHYLFHGEFACLKLLISKVLVTRSSDPKLKALEKVVDSIVSMLQFYETLDTWLSIEEEENRRQRFLDGKLLQPEKENPFYVDHATRWSLIDILNNCLESGFGGSDASDKQPKMFSEKAAAMKYYKETHPPPKPKLGEGARVFFGWKKYISDIAESTKNQEDMRYRTLAILLTKRDVSTSQYSPCLAKMVEHLSLPNLPVKLKVCVLLLLRQLLSLDASIVQKDEAYLIDKSDVHPQSMIAMRPVRRQNTIASYGMRSIIDLTGSSDASVARAALRCGVALLEGGNITIQQIIKDYLHSVTDETFFVIARATLQKCKSLSIEKRKMLKVMLGKVGWDMDSKEKYPDDVMEQITSRFDFSSVVCLLRFIQLLCEGHFLDVQDYLRCQNDNTISIDLVSEVASTIRYVFKSLDRCAFEVADQMIQTLSEVVQGPCLGNQEVIVSASIGTAVNVLFEENFPDCSFQQIWELKNTTIVMLLSTMEGCSNPTIYIALASQLDLNLLASDMDLSLELWKQHDCDDFGVPYSLQPDMERKDYLQLGCNVFMLHKELMAGISADHPIRAKVAESLNTHRSFQFFNKRTASVEILRDGHLHVANFRIPSMSIDNLKEEQRNRLIHSINRESQPAKLASFFELAFDAIREMEYYQEIATSKGKQFLIRYSWFVDYVGIIVAIILNLILFFATDTNHHPSATTRSGSAIYLQKGALADFYTALGVILMVIQIPMCLTLYIGPLQVYLKDCWRNWVSAKEDLLIEESRADLGVYEVEFDMELEAKTPKWKQAVMSAKYAFAFGRLWNRIFFLVIAFLGFFVHPVCYALQLLQILGKSSQLMNTVMVITKNGRILILTGLVMFVVAYIFSITAYYGLNDEYHKAKNPEDTAFNCDTLARCFAIHVLYGLRMPDGIGGALWDINPVDWRSPSAYGRLIFEFCFFVVFMVLLLNIVFGTIIDTFAELRETRRFVETDQRMKCFICGIEASVFDRSTSGGFKFHVRFEHNMWTYLYFLHYLKNKQTSDFTGLESYVNQLSNKRMSSFFPIGRSISLEAATAVKDDEPLHEIKQTVEDAMSTLRTIKQSLDSVQHLVQSHPEETGRENRSREASLTFGFR